MDNKNQDYQDDDNCFFQLEEMQKEDKDKLYQLALIALVKVIPNEEILMKFKRLKGKPSSIANMDIKTLLKMLVDPKCPSFINFSVDLRKLVPYLESQKHSAQQRNIYLDDIRWLIKNEAPKSKIIDIFPNLEREELDMWISIVLKENKKVYQKIGRHKVIKDDFVVHRLLNEWHKPEIQDMTELERLKHIKNQFEEYSLAVLISTINSNERVLR